MSRYAVLGAVFVFIVGFLYLTVRAIADQGFTVASALSLLILLLVGVGVVGSLLNPPR
jgi:hypothetical protein